MNLVFTIYGMKFILPVFTNEPPQEEVIYLKGENYFNLVERVERLEAEVERLEAGIDRLEAENAKKRLKGGKSNEGRGDEIVGGPAEERGSS